MNPEFKRNLWLDATPFRQIIMPFAVIALSYFVYLVNDKTFGLEMATYSATSFLALMIFWGARAASDTMMDEINQRTWDFQRMSAMGAWQMTWGKLIGGSFYPWVSGLLFLGCYVLSMWDQLTVTETVKTTLMLIVAACFSITLGLLNTLFLIRKSDQASSRQVNGINLIVGLYILLAIAPIFTKAQTDTVTWYSHHIGRLDFLLCSSVALLLWTIIGAYRLMRQELQYENSALVWLGFMLFQLAYWPGLVVFDVAAPFNIFNTSSYILLFVIATILTWASIYISDNSIAPLRRLFIAASEHRFVAMSLHVPLWCVSYGVLCILAVMLYWETGGRHSNVSIVIVMCLLFVLRDILIKLFFNLQRRNSRPDASSLAVTLILYLLLPMLIGAADAPILYCFLPIPAPTAPWMSVLPVVLQVVVLMSFVSRQYRTQWRHDV